MIYAFGECVLDIRLHILFRAGQPVSLRPKAFEALVYLLTHRDGVVSKQELSEQVWPEQFISDATLGSTMRAVRQAIGDSGGARRIIQTIHGYGYRCVTTVTVQAETEAQCGTAEEEPTAGPAASAPERKRDTGVKQAREPIPIFDTLQSLPLLPPPLAGERKLVTFLCCALDNTQAPLKQHGLDTLYNRIRVLYELVRNIVLQYGGTLQPVVGNRILAAFGVPVAYEDHALRAALAALALRQCLDEHLSALGELRDVAPEISIGLHTGLVAVGGLGDDAELITVLLGDASAMAVTLQAQAEPGTILCSDVTARLVQGVCYLEAIASSTVTEHGATTALYKISGRRFQRVPNGQRAERPLSQFVGRVREIAALHALLEQVENGQGHVVGVIGEPGIGKSRLLYEFYRGLQGRALTYLQGRCLSYGKITPYLPVRDLLCHYCGLIEIDTPEVLTTKVHQSLQKVHMAPDDWASYLLQLLGVSGAADQIATLSPQERKARTFATLIQMCVNSSQQRPLLIEVEDLHWIDATSEEWLVALAERVAGVPILVLGTYRPGYRPPWLDLSHATQIALTRLTPRDSLQVVHSVPQAEHFSDALTRDILTKADGNPFFLEELAHTIVEQGADKPLREVPDTVQAVLASRIDRLPAPDKHLLQVAAVIGKDIPLYLMEAVMALPPETLYQSLQHLQAAEFLYESRLLPVPIYTFKHVLTQEVAYQSLLHSTRQLYHGQIAQMLAKHFPEVAITQPELLAYHYTEAGSPAEAVLYWLQAGQRAAERSANIEAVSHLTTGLALLLTLPDTPERVHQELRLQITLGRALMATKGYGAAEVGQAYARARALCQQIGDTPQLFTVLRGLATFYYMRAEHQAAREIGEQCLSLAQRTHDAALLLRAHLTLGQLCLFLGEYARTHAYLTEGRALTTSRQYGSRVIRAVQDAEVTCCALSVPTLWLLGYPDQARQRSDEVLCLARELQHPFSLAEALIFTSVLCICTREYAAVQRHAESVMMIATEHGFPHWGAHATVYRGWALAMRGQGNAGIAQIHHGQAAWQAIGGELARPWFCALLAEAYGRVGHIKAGLTTLEEALGLAAHRGERHYESEFLRLRGELLLEQEGLGTRAQSNKQQWVVAEECLLQALDVARHQQAKSLELRTAISLGRLWRHQGKTVAARQLLTEIYGWFTEGRQTADVQAAQALLEELS